MKYAREFPTTKMFRLPKSPYYIENKFLYKLFFILLNVIPAYIMEIASKMLSSKPLPIVKVTRETFYAFGVLTAFMSPMRFKNENFQRLVLTMTKEDQLNFPFTTFISPSDIYVKSIVQGIGKYFLSETEKDLKAAKEKVKIFVLVDYFLDAVFCAVIYFTFSKLIKSFF